MPTIFRPGQLTPRTKSKIKRPDCLTKTDGRVAIAELPPPQKGKQTDFYNSRADIVLYGGAAGGGKSAGLLLTLAKKEYLKNSEYKAVIFRRTYPMIKNPGGLLDESQKFYNLVNGRLVLNPLDWKFPSGAKIVFRQLQYDKSVYEYQGAQIGFIGFDELTHFTEKQFFYMLSRNRSTSGLASRICCTCNPDADSWVTKLVDWYLDENGNPDDSKSGVVRYFVRPSEELVWGETREELKEIYPDLMAKSFAFIPASIQDNQILLDKDPAYLANLNAQHPVEKARLLSGNWKTRYQAGTIFDRTWFNVIDELPDIPIRTKVRFWDLAATEESVAKSTSYYSAGCKAYLLENGEIIIADLVAEQRSPGRLDALIEATAIADGVSVKVRWELEGGSSGKLYEKQLRNNLQSKIKGVDAIAIKPLKDKVTRAVPCATDASRGRISLLRGSWIDRFLNAVGDFDGTKKPLTNDIVDALDGAYHVIEKIIPYVPGSLALTKDFSQRPRSATQDSGFNRTKKSASRARQRSRPRGRY